MASPEELAEAGEAETELRRVAELVVAELGPPGAAPLVSPVPAPWAAALRREAGAIRREYESFVAWAPPPPAARSLGVLASPETVGPEAAGWDYLPLKVQGAPTPFAGVFPHTAGAAERAGATSAGFSSLAPGAALAPHRGGNAGVLRYHLCLVSDPGCRLTLDGAMRSHVWTEGADVLFDDTHLHSVAHRGRRARVVLFLDVPRPMASPAMAAFVAFLATQRLTPIPRQLASRARELYLEQAARQLADEPFFAEGGAALLRSAVASWAGCGDSPGGVIDVGGSGRAAFLLATSAAHLHGRPLPVWAARPAQPAHLRSLLRGWQASRAVTIDHRPPGGPAASYAGPPAFFLHISVPPSGEGRRAALEAFLPCVAKGGAVVVRPAGDGCPPDATRVGDAACWFAAGPSRPFPAFAPPPPYSFDLHGFGDGEVLFPWVDRCVILTHDASPRTVAPLLARRPAREVWVQTGPHWRDPRGGFASPYEAIREAVGVAFARARGLPSLLVLEDDCVLGTPPPAFSEGVREKLESGAAAYSLGALVLDGEAAPPHLRVRDGRAAHAVIYSEPGRARLLALMGERPGTFHDRLLYGEMGEAAEVWAPAEPLAVQPLEPSENSAAWRETWPSGFRAKAESFGEGVEGAWRLFRAAHRGEADVRASLRGFGRASAPPGGSEMCRAGGAAPARSASVA